MGSRSERIGSHCGLALRADRSHSERIALRADRSPERIGSEHRSRTRLSEGVFNSARSENGPFRKRGTLGLHVSDWSGESGTEGACAMAKHGRSARGCSEQLQCCPLPLGPCHLPAFNPCHLPLAPSSTPLQDW